ncbi:uncharacterized protein KY384_004439 [Bacidia gigantensis]|uniref:uncharacterized protein n=1 Tax=Bacidia gigantensis TaxID=2732470 RepID=UPI001D03C913|nr:uncharacterized protein KY384_004439 [Bacidia gigantensis]KAG8531082.1 hypothetical protein KY384_004439 [Bacidia gigantensis]
MSGRSSFWLCHRAIVNRPNSISAIHFTAVPGIRPHTRRGITSDDKPLPEAEKGSKGPNQEQLPHVSEEAAATSKVTGEEGPDLEQGTPVQEVLQRDKKAMENAPKVLQNDINQPKPSGTRSYSTSTRRRAQANIMPTSTSVQGYGEGQGHMFPLPDLPLPSKSHIRRRYEPIVDQFTKLMMKHGELSKAQSVGILAGINGRIFGRLTTLQTMAMILERLRTGSPPSNTQKPLYPNSPPPSHLPLNPITFLTTAVDSVAPLLRIRSQKGAAGGGMALQIPVPLTLRQRRRTAILWILDAASKKQIRGGGRSQFPNKVADEIIATVEGKSSAWEKRQGIHKLSVNARANLGTRLRRYKNFT